MDHEVDSFTLKSLKDNTIKTPLQQKKEYFFFSIGVIGMATIAAFQMSLNWGLNPWDGVGRSLSYIFSVRVGTIVSLQAIGLAILQLIILNKNYRMKHFMQFLIGLFVGNVINFVFYNFFEVLDFNNYYITGILFVVSLFLSALFISLIQISKVSNLPLEGLLTTVSEKTNLSFTFLRFLFDIVSVIVVLILTIVFKIPLTIREGTIASALLFTPFLSINMKIFKSYL